MKEESRQDRLRLAGMDAKLCIAEYGNGVLRPYRLFIPASYRFAPSAAGTPPEPHPLVVMLHGGGSAGFPCDENWYFANRESTDRVQTVAAERGYLVACPALPFTRIAGNAPDRVEQMIEEIVKDCLPMIDAVIREILYDYHVDPGRVYLSGASRGGLAAYAAVHAGPGRFASIAAVCTTCPREWVARIAEVPTVMLHAVEDAIFPIREARELKRTLEGRGCDVELVEFPGGHDGLRFTAAYSVIFDWFDAHPGSTATGAPPTP